MIRLVDNKVLDEYKNERFCKQFIYSTTKVLEIYGFKNFRMTLVETNKFIE
jgi:hypothetical protein